ncbi:MAG TPA: hypothetical protein VNW97_03525 [Candidatus Saccharimonadales bacterium]|jgi:hypothetical protein|nr:hypothetical protein [Candidatus Saccharimonadales bacterium]
MMNQVARALLTVCTVLLFGASMQAQRRPSGPPNLPDGTPINVRINENLSSETSQPGARFTGTLFQPVAANGSTVFPRGATVTGKITSVTKSGRLSGPGVLELMIVSINNTSISSQPFVIRGASHTKNNLTKIGGGTAAGAIIGGIAGGGKGAAIGAGVGAGAGTATAAATGRKPASVESEAVLGFVSGGPPIRTSDTRSAPGDYSSPDDSDDRRRPRGDDYHAGRHRSHDDDEDEDDDDDRQRGSHHDDRYIFTERDRDVLNGCLSGYDFESLPPGIQKKLARGGSLPPGQAKKLRSLPSSCNARLPRLPRDYERIIFGNRVLIVQGGNHILDIIIF